jgi:hypothetical protein
MAFDLKLSTSFVSLSFFVVENIFIKVAFLFKSLFISVLIAKRLTPITFHSTFIYLCVCVSFLNEAKRLNC